jgi:ADP-glucose pyrophosphorylase
VRDVRAALLAGGRGERMGRLTAATPKPLVPYAGCCRLLDFSLRNAAASGIGEVVLMSAERERQLVGHVLRWWDDRPGFRVHLGPNEGLRADPDRPLAGREPELGPADALLTNAAYVFAPPVRDVLVQHADHVYTYDYAAMLASHRDNRADVTIGVQRIERRYVRLFGMVEADPDGRVRRLVEKPDDPTSDLVFTAFCLFHARVLREVLDGLAALPTAGWQHDISRDVLPVMIEAGLRVRAFQVQGYWADIGTVDRYHLGHLALLDDPAALPAALLPRTLGAPPPERSGDNLAAADAVLGGATRRSVLYPGVVVEPGAVVRRSVLLPGARVRAGVSALDTIVGEGETLTADRTGLSELRAGAAPAEEGEQL